MIRKIIFREPPVPLSGRQEDLNITYKIGFHLLTYSFLSYEFCLWLGIDKLLKTDLGIDKLLKTDLGIDKLIFHLVQFYASIEV